MHFSDERGNVGALEPPDNQDLADREVLRIDREPDAVVLQLTDFKTGAQLRGSFFDCA